MFKELDPILHSQLRLAVMSLLIGVKEAEFTFIREKTGSTAGNLSVQISKLKEAGIGFGNIYPSVMSSQPGAQKYLTRHFGGDMGKLLCSSVLNLPLFPYMTEDELNAVVLCVKQAMQGVTR